jgi:hypothetical protein
LVVDSQMTEIDPIEQTSRIAGVAAYLLYTIISGVTSILAARTLTSEDYGAYASKMAVVAGFGTVAILGANYKIMRDTPKDQLLAVSLFFLKVDGLVVIVAGTVLLAFFDVNPVVPIAAFLVVTGQILFAIVVRLGRKNSVLLAQIASSVVLLGVVIGMAASEIFTESRFILASTATFSIGFLWQLRRNWNPSTQARRLSGEASPLGILRSAIALQLCYVPALLIVALLPSLTSVNFLQSEVSMVAAVMSYGTLFQALGNFLTYSVFVPNILNLREANAHQSRVRREFVRQNSLMLFVAVVFLVGVSQVGDDALPVIMGETFFATSRDVFSVCLIFVLQSLVFSQTAFGMLTWPTRGLIAFQLTCLLCGVFAVVFALVATDSIGNFLLVIAVGSAIPVIVGFLANLRAISRKSVADHE